MSTAANALTHNTKYLNKISIENLCSTLELNFPILFHFHTKVPLHDIICTVRFCVPTSEKCLPKNRFLCVVLLPLMKMELKRVCVLVKKRYKMVKVLVDCYSVKKRVGWAKWFLWTRYVKTRWPCNVYRYWPEWDIKSGKRIKISWNETITNKQKKRQIQWKYKENSISEIRALTG